MEALLVPEKPGPEWFSITEIKTNIKLKRNTLLKLLDNKTKNNQLEKKKFVINGKWNNFYRVKK